MLRRTTIPNDLLPMLERAKLVSTCQAKPSRAIQFGVESLLQAAKFAALSSTQWADGGIRAPIKEYNKQ